MIVGEEKIEKQASEQLAQIAKELVKQNRSRLRFRIFLAIIVMLYLAFTTYLALRESGVIEAALKKEKPFIAEVALSGQVGSEDDINTDETVLLLESAFSEANAVAVILRLNSPGGSPVQAHQIYNAIKRLMKYHDKKLYVVIEDICTSACYLIASSAHKIYANPASIIGSIGVIISSFGAVDAIEKLGITRRLYIAGEHKALLDMFSPEDKEAVAHIQHEILAKSHRLFISDVKAGRDSKLVNEAELFSGLVWLAKKSKSLGLIDDIGDVHYVANEVIGIKTRILYEPAKTLFEQFTEFSAQYVIRSMLNYINTNQNIILK